MHHCGTQVLQTGRLTLRQVNCAITCTDIGVDRQQQGHFSGIDPDRDAIRNGG